MIISVGSDGAVPIDDVCSELIASRPVLLKLKGSAEAALFAARAEVRQFFTKEIKYKQKFADPSFNYGFREFGRQFSIEPSRPDLNESFVYRGNSSSGIPNNDLLNGLLPALSDYWRFCERICSDTFATIANSYGSGQDIDFGKDSYIETNWYHSSSDRDLLQDRHEDGHIFTLASANNRGLEVEVEGEMVPVDFQELDIVLMPGSLLTEITSGDIRPVYHQVRNHGVRERSAILFLGNPAFDEPVYPFGNSFGPNIGELARKKGAMFGLPDAPD